MSGSLLGALLGFLAVGGRLQIGAQPTSVIPAWRRLLLTAIEALLQQQEWALSVVALGALLGGALALFVGRIARARQGRT